MGTSFLRASVCVRGGGGWISAPGDNLSSLHFALACLSYHVQNARPPHTHTHPPPTRVVADDGVALDGGGGEHHQLRARRGVGLDAARDAELKLAWGRAGVGEGREGRER